MLVSEIIEVKNLVKVYGSKGQIKALDGVSLSVKEGDFVGIMGPSGSGKSTLLNMIGTVDTPSKGAVYLDGENIRELREGKIAEFRYKNLVKVYGSKGQIKALDGVSLSVKEGDFVGIMGPSGSGKSTLLNMIGTVDTPSKGAVYLDGENIRELREGKIAEFRYKNIGFIFQEFNLLDNLTLRENISVPLVLDGISKDVIKDKVDKMSKKLGIEDQMDKYPQECSGGQRQRAAAARALVTDPKVIIADEPTGNLDTKTSHELLQFLKDLNETEGKTIVMVTHDAMIASYTKKLVFLRDGKIEEIIEKGDKSQMDFFYDIVEVTTKENKNLFIGMGRK